MGSASMCMQVSEGESYGQSEITPPSPLENPLVVHHVLSHFSTQELLSLSTVNKLWNYEARIILRDHRICVAYITGNEPCVNAKVLNDQIAKMKSVHLNGLSVCIREHKCPPGLVGAGNIAEIYANCESKLDLKHLTVAFCEYEAEDCILGQFMLRILCGSARLERLEIAGSIPLCVQQLRADNRPAEEQGGPRFPRLKTLKLPAVGFNLQLSSELVQELFASTAPNLQVLENTVSPNVLKEIPVKCWRIIKKMEFFPLMMTVMLELNEKTVIDICRFMQGSPRLHAVRLMWPSEFLQLAPREEHFLTLVRYLLRSSCDSLKEFEMDPYCGSQVLPAGQAPPDLNNDTLKFKNVTRLRIQVLSGGSIEVDASLLRLRIMQNMFPSVREVSFVPREWIGGERTPRVLPDFRGPTPWAAVSKVTIVSYSPIVTLLREMSSLFPGLESIRISIMLHTQDAPEFRLLWSMLWSNWQGLRYLEMGINYHGCEHHAFEENYDAEFCGVYPEEAARLRQMDDDYLKTVHIVPPFPAINYHKALKHVRIALGSGLLETKPLKSNARFFLSKVAQFVAFRHLTGLKFELVVPLTKLLAQHLEHLEPWLKLQWQALAGVPKYGLDTSF